MKLVSIVLGLLAIVNFALAQNAFSISSNEIVGERMAANIFLTLTGYKNEKPFYVNLKKKGNEDLSFMSPLTDCVTSSGKVIFKKDEFSLVKNVEDVSPCYLKASFTEAITANQIVINSENTPVEYPIDNFRVVSSDVSFLSTKDGSTYHKLPVGTDLKILVELPKQLFDNSDKELVVEITNLKFKSTIKSSVFDTTGKQSLGTAALRDDSLLVTLKNRKTHSFVLDMKIEEAFEEFILTVSVPQLNFVGYSNAIAKKDPYPLLLTLSPLDKVLVSEGVHAFDVTIVNHENTNAKIDVQDLKVDILVNPTESVAISKVSAICNDGSETQKEVAKVDFNMRTLNSVKFNVISLHSFDSQFVKGSNIKCTMYLTLDKIATTPRKRDSLSVTKVMGSRPIVMQTFSPIPVNKLDVYANAYDNSVDGKTLLRVSLPSYYRGSTVKLSGLDCGSVRDVSKGVRCEKSQSVATLIVDEAARVSFDFLGLTFIADPKLTSLNLLGATGRAIAPIAVTRKNAQEIGITGSITAHKNLYSPQPRILTAGDLVSLDFDYTPTGDLATTENYFKFIVDYSSISPHISIGFLDSSAYSDNEDIIDAANEGQRLIITARTPITGPLAFSYLIRFNRDLPVNVLGKKLSISVAEADNVAIPLPASSFTFPTVAAIQPNSAVVFEAHHVQEDTFKITFSTSISRIIYPHMFKLSFTDSKTDDLIVGGHMCTFTHAAGEDTYNSISCVKTVDSPGSATTITISVEVDREEGLPMLTAVFADDKHEILYDVPVRNTFLRPYMPTTISDNALLTNSFQRVWFKMPFTQTNVHRPTIFKWSNLRGVMTLPKFGYIKKTDENGKMKDVEAAQIVVVNEEVVIIWLESLTIKDLTLGIDLVYHNNALEESVLMFNIIHTYDFINPEPTPEALIESLTSSPLNFIKEDFGLYSINIKPSPITVYSIPSTTTAAGVANRLSFGYNTDLPSVDIVISGVNDFKTADNIEVDCGEEAKVTVDEYNIMIKTSYLKKNLCSILFKTPVEVAALISINVTPVDNLAATTSIALPPVQSFPKLTNTNIKYHTDQETSIYTPIAVSIFGLDLDYNRLPNQQPTSVSITFKNTDLKLGKNHYCQDQFGNSLKISHIESAVKDSQSVVNIKFANYHQSYVANVKCHISVAPTSPKSTDGEAPVVTTVTTPYHTYTVNSPIDVTTNLDTIVYLDYLFAEHVLHDVNGLIYTVNNKVLTVGDQIITTFKEYMYAENYTYEDKRVSAQFADGELVVIILAVDGPESTNNVFKIPLGRIIKAVGDMMVTSTFDNKTFNHQMYKTSVYQPKFTQTSIKSTITAAFSSNLNSDSYIQINAINQGTVGSLIDSFRSNCPLVTNNVNFKKEDPQNRNSFIDQYTVYVPKLETCLLKIVLRERVLAHSHRLTYTTIFNNEVKTTPFASIIDAPIFPNKVEYITVNSDSKRSERGVYVTVPLPGLFASDHISIDTQLFHIDNENADVLAKNIILLAQPDEDQDDGVVIPLNAPTKTYEYVPNTKDKWSFRDQVVIFFPMFPRYLSKFSMSINGFKAEFTELTHITSVDTETVTIHPSRVTLLKDASKTIVGKDGLMKFDVTIPLQEQVHLVVDYAETAVTSIDSCFNDNTGAILAVENRDHKALVLHTPSFDVKKSRITCLISTSFSATSPKKSLVGVSFVYNAPKMYTFNEIIDLSEGRPVAPVLGNTLSESTVIVPVSAHRAAVDNTVKFTLTNSPDLKKIEKVYVDALSPVYGKFPIVVESSSASDLHTVSVSFPCRDSQELCVDSHFLYQASEGVYSLYPTAADYSLSSSFFYSACRFRCGFGCMPCEVENKCKINLDCTTGFCKDGVCAQENKKGGPNTIFIIIAVVAGLLVLGVIVFFVRRYILRQEQDKLRQGLLNDELDSLSL